MATFKKVILSPGVYHAPQGTLHATPGRVRGWAKTFARMNQNGIRVPICWGHQPGAIPGEGKGKADRQYELSRYNAGYIRNLSVSDDGDLEGELDIPGADVDEDGNLITWAEMPDGRKVRCAIKEVSAAIRDWQDGSGRKWPDAITHVALVPLPVVAGQTGFETTLGTDAGVPGEIHLSLATYLGPEEGEGKAMPMIDAADMVEAPAVGSDPVSECLGILEQIGLHLPMDTDEGNLCERIRLVGGALLKAGVFDKPGAEGEPDGDEAPMWEDEESGMEDEMPLEDEGMEDEMPLDEEGMEDEMPLDEGEENLGTDEEGLDEDGEMEVSGDSDGLPGGSDEDEEDEGEDATEEPRPIMMGTQGKGGLVLRTSLEKLFANQVKASIQQQRLARVSELAAGGLPRHRAEALRKQIKATPVHLARRKGRIVAVESRVDVELSTLEGVAQGGWVTSGPQGKIKRAARPRLESSGKVSKKFIEESAASVSTPRRK